MSQTLVHISNYGLSQRFFFNVEVLLELNKSASLRIKIACEKEPILRVICTASDSIFILYQIHILPHRLLNDLIR